MHTSFDLKPEATLTEFEAALGVFSARMQAQDLVVETGKVARRCEHPIMDTDSQRRHQYFFVMSFRDREQCDAAVEHIQSQHADTDGIHKAVYANIVDPIFSCWEN